MIEQYKDFMNGNVLTTRGFGDCTNGGVSSKYNTLAVCKDYVTKEEVIEYCKEHKYYEPEQFFKVDIIWKGRDIEYHRLEPIIKREGAINMFGGNYLSSSDSRFREITGISYPIAIMDRYETPEEYEIYST